MSQGNDVLATRQEPQPTLVKPATSVQEFISVCDEWRNRAIVLSPITVLDSLPAIYQVSMRVVKIDATVPARNQSGPEVYHSALFHNKDGAPTEVSLGKVGIMKLMAAAGLSPKTDECGRTDDRRDAHFCEYRAVVIGQDFDGSFRTAVNTKAIDLRDGSVEANSMKSNPGQLAQSRRHIVRMCETKALEGAVRTWLGLQQKYSVEELARKPFLVPKLVLRADDPRVADRMIEAALNPTRQLYGPRPGEDVREVKDVSAAEAGPRKQPAPSNGDGQHRPEPSHTDAPAPSDPDDYEALDIPDTPATSGLVVCACPCGDQVQITEAARKASVEQYGSPRCGACFPGPRFNVEEHKDITDLRLPNRPALTVQQIAAALAKKAGGK